MDAALFSSPTWFYIDSDGQERGPFRAKDMLGWYRDGYFPAQLLVRRNIYSNYIRLSSLALGNVVDSIHNVQRAAKPQKVEGDKLSEISGTENEEEYVEREIKEECFKLEIKAERIKPEIEDECIKLETKEECAKTEIKVECLKPVIEKEYLRPERKECAKIKIIKEKSKSAETHGSETEEEYIEPENNEEFLKLESKEECIKNEIQEVNIKLEVDEMYINPEMKDKFSNPELKKEYIKPEVKKEYPELIDNTNTRHEREVPDLLHNDVFSFDVNAKPEVLHIYEGKNKLKLKGETEQGALVKEKSNQCNALKCKHLHKVRKGILKFSRGITKRNLSRPSNKKHVHFHPFVMEINQYDNDNPVERVNEAAIIVEQLKARGIFDKFRDDCLADADKKPAYQNLKHRVNAEVNRFLAKREWKSTLNRNALINKNALRNRNALRNELRTYISSGVDRIVDELVNPELTGRIMPEAENVIKNMFGNPLTQVDNVVENCCNKMENGEIPSSHAAEDVDMDAQGALILNLPEPVPARKGAS